MRYESGKLYSVAWRRRWSFALMASLPVVTLMIMDFNSFYSSWNLGRGGFLFVMLFLIIDYLEARGELHWRLSPSRLLSTLVTLALIMAYYISSKYLEVHGALWKLGEWLKVPLLYSWTWLWDYIFFSLYLVLLTYSYFGREGFRALPTGLVYAGGMAMILSLDAFFPYDTLGPLQAVVPIILRMVVAMVGGLDLGEATTSQNILHLVGQKGSMSLAVYWPSAGVHSMVIYSLVVLLFLVRTRFPRLRKVLYFTLGAIGTFFVNVLRIFVVSLYVLLVSTNPIQFEEFHAVIGEALFLPWLVVFILAVSRYELRRSRRVY